MTTYQSGAAFRRALEDRLAAQSIKTQMPLVRLRKLVVFDRFLARLVQLESGSWLLKGGLVLQLRLSQHARTTKDIDILSLATRDEVPQILTHAAQLDLQDWFSFAVRPDTAALPGPGHGGQRFFVTALVAGRTFESFHIDVGSGDPVSEPAEMLETPPLLTFAGILPVMVPCYPLSQHLAEKVHAYVRPRATGEGTRVKDLVDIVFRRTHGGQRSGAARRGPGHLHGSRGNRTADEIPGTATILGLNLQEVGGGGWATVHDIGGG